MGDVPNELGSAFTCLSEVIQHPHFDNQPITSQTTLPSVNHIMISPIKCHGNPLNAKTLQEVELHEAHLKGQLCGQQAALVLQNFYCEQMRNEMHGIEEKKKKKKGGTGVKIKEVNQKGRLLTSDEIIGLYAQHQAEIQEHAAEKKRKKRRERSILRHSRGGKNKKWSGRGSVMRSRLDIRKS